MTNCLKQFIVSAAVIFFLVFQAANAQTSVSGNQSGTWTKANSPYTLTGSVLVPSGQTLIIQPGVIVKMPRRDFTVSVQGKLLALGTITDSIKFKGEANASLSGSSHGGTLIFSAFDSSYLQYVSIDSIGDLNNTSNTMAISAAGGLVIANSSIRNSEGVQINILSSRVRIENSNFDVNSSSWGIQIYTNGLTPLITGNVFSGSGRSFNAVPSSLQNTHNNTNAIISILGVVNVNCTLRKPGPFSRYRLSGLGVNANTTLTIEPGCTIESNTYNAPLTIDGTLIANGTIIDSIYFKGKFQSSQYMYGSQISFSASSRNSSMQYVSLDSMSGSPGATNQFAVEARSISIKNCSFLNYGFDALHIAKSDVNVQDCFFSAFNTKYLAIEMESDTIRPTVKNCVFQGKEVARLIYGNPTCFANFSNITNAIASIWWNVAENCTLPRLGPNSFYLLNNVTVNAGKTLTILPGTAIQCDYNSKLTINGTLIANGTVSDSIFFIGKSSSTSRLYGGAIEFGPTSVSSSITYTSLDSMGDPYGSFALKAKSLLFTNSSIRNSGSRAIEIDRSNVTINNCSFSSANTTSPSVYLSSDTILPIIKNCSFFGSEQARTIYTPPIVVSNFTNNTNGRLVLWGNVTKDCTFPKPGSNSYYELDGTLTINSAKILTLQPGVEIRSTHYYDLIAVNGTLKAQGSTGDSVLFRGFSNTTYSSSSTHGGYINFGANSANSVLEFVSIDRWGDINFNGNNGAVSINSNSVLVTNSNIRNSEGTGINVSASATISNSTLDNNPTSDISISSSNITPVISNITFANTTNSISTYPSSAGGISNCNNAKILINNTSTGIDCTLPKPGTNSYYELNGGFTVSSGKILTVQPGVEIRSTHYYDVITVNGSLKAQGTATDSILFRGFANPSYTPASTHGGYINFTSNSTNSILEHVSIDRWGDINFNGNNGAVSISSNSVLITKSSIRNSEGFGTNIGALSSTITDCIYSNNQSTGINIGLSAASPTISNVIFTNSTKAITTYPSSANGISNCSNARIELLNTSTGIDCLLPKPGLNSYYELNGGFTVSTGKTLTIQPGVEIRSTHYYDVITVNGSLKAQGTATDSILFRGFANPSYTPASTHGGYINFTSNSTNSILEHVSIDRWGDINFNGNNGAVSISSNSVLITKSSIRNSEQTAVYIVPSTITPTISEIKFANNEQSIFSNPSSLGGISNCINARIVINNTSTGIDCILPKPGTDSYYELNGGFTISSGKTLTIQPGVEIRSTHYYDIITVNGTLKAQGIAADSIFFRGFANSTYTPASTHGGYLNFTTTSTNSVLEYVSIDRWGDVNYFGNSGAVSINSSSVSIAKSTIRNGERTAIFISPGSIVPTISGVKFANNEQSIFSHPSSLGGITNCTDARILINSTSTGSDCLLPNPGINSYYQLDGNVTISTGKTMTIQPGVEIRSAHYYDAITVDGTLKAIGTATDSILFRGFANPSYTPTSTHGGHINFTLASTNSALEYVSIDRWGDVNYFGNSGAIRINSSVSITKSSVKNSENIAINNDGSSNISETSLFGNQVGFYSGGGRPTLSNCKIYDNTNYGIQNVSGTTFDTVDARTCYWGNPSGPYHTTLNSAGNGNKVSDKVKFVPWIQQLTKVDQTVTLPAISDRFIEDSVILNAIASSGLGIIYTISTVPASAVAMLNENMIRFNSDTGRVTVVATQAGNEFYNPAQAQQTFKVLKHIQSISFAALQPKIFGDSSFVLHANASSGLAIVFSIISGPATINQDSIVTLTGAGTVIVQASQPGNTLYFATMPVQRSFVVYPKAPDLVVRDVTSNPISLAPNDSVIVSWRIGNIGRASSAVNWTERIYIQTPAGASRTFLGQVSFSNSSILDTAREIIRTTTIALTSQLNIGDSGVFVVEVLPSQAIQEIPGTTANNIAIQTLPFGIKKVLSLQLQVHQITEGATGISATVYRSGSFANALTVNVSNKIPSRLTVPTSVTIPAGHIGASFTMQAPDNSSVEAVLKDTLSVTANNFQPANDTILIVDNDLASFSIINLPIEATEGDTVRFKLVTNLAPSAPLTVYLNSSNRNRFPIPNSVIIPKDSLSALVTIKIPQNGIPDVDATVRITAGAANQNPADTTIKVKDDDLPGLQLELQTNLISETAGPYATQATLKRIDTSNTVAFTANLTASLPNTLILPATISLAANEKEKTFTIGVIDNALVDSQRVVSITASIFVASCGCTAPPLSAGSISANLIVSDNDGPALQLTVSQVSLQEGFANAGILRVSRNTPTTGALSVSLSSSDTTEAVLPGTVIIPAGQSYIDVPITTKADTLTDGNQQVHFTATASGFSSGSVWVMVTDLNKPDLLISSVVLGDTSVQALGLFSYSVAVKNIGSSTAPSGVLVRGYLSLDDAIDNSDLLISTDTVAVPIAAGQTIQVLNAAQALDFPGRYKLIYQVNPELRFTELITTNNTSLPKAVIIKPDYTATANVASSYFFKGAPIIINGTATKSNGAPAMNKNVDVFIITNGLRRTISATTNTTGSYTTQFIPPSGEAGHYTVGACFPGLADTTVQDAFDILGVNINNGAVPRFTVIMNDTLRGTLPVKNLSNKSLNNFSLIPVSLPNGAQISFDTVAALAGNATVNLRYTIIGSALTSGNNFQVANLRALSTEGIIQPAQLYYYCQAPNAFITADVDKLNTTVSQTPGERLVEFRLVNKGVGASGNITITLPQVSWLSNVTPKTMPSISMGDTTVVILKFTATSDVPFDYPVNGNINISSQNGNSFLLPFTFKKVAQANGVVKITATNQFTYYAAGEPKVKDAHVVIKNYFTGVIYAQGYTDSTGVFSAVNVPEGRHRIVVEKDKHLPYNNVIIVNPGDTTKSVVFLNYQAITFSWNVVPTAIPDQYTVTLTSQFETNIPIPVVTIDLQDTLPALTGDQTYPFILTLTNHGLITAKEVTLIMPDHPVYEFVTNYQPADLLAKQSIQVPVLLRRRPDIEQGRHHLQSFADQSQFLGIQSPTFRTSQTAASPCLPVTIDGIYWYECNSATGVMQPIKKPITIKQDCTPAYNPETGVFNPGGLYGALYFILSHWGGPSGSGGGGPVWDGYKPCDTCPPVVTPPPTPPTPFENLLKNCNLPMCALDLLKTIPNCAKAVAATAGAIGSGGTLSPLAGARILKCLKKLYDLTDSPYCPALLDAIREAISQSRQSQRTSLSTESALRVVAQLLKDMVFVADAHSTQERWSLEYFGNIIYSDAWDKIADSIGVYIANKDSIPQTAQQSILTEIAGYDIQSADVDSFLKRWNTSIGALRNNILQPNPQYPNIINWTRVAAFADSLVIAQTRINSEGFATSLEMYDAKYEELMDFVNQQKEAVCAKITVQFSQQLTMTREAFDGTLEIFNGHPTDKMDSLSVEIKITDANGVPSNGLFQINAGTLTNLANITGTGQINAQQKGSVKFLFIPEVGAAPQTPKIYNFGGLVRYWDPYVQAMVTMPLSDVALTVNPSPNLMLHYFMQRNILGDDALTSPEIEPSVPAELAVMAENQGYGPAVNMMISSAQPKIVENEKGLAVNFVLIGSNYQGQPTNFGVTDINFGTVPPLQTRIGQWYFTSSLLGKFVSYQAEVVHANSFGNPELSLIKGVKIHELTKSIKVYGANDGLNDFLVNDIFDVNDQPDIIYYSQGIRTAKVYPALSGSFSSFVAPPSFTNTLTVNPSDTGWNYIKLADPGSKMYELVSVTRSDGQVIPLNNAWLTFVTLPVNQPPLYENKFHFVDTFPSLNAATYTVIWKPKNLDVPMVDSIKGVTAVITSEPVQHLQVVFNKPINASTFTYEDLSLTFQGGADIMSNAVVITQVDSITFDVDLSALTTGNGFYNFTAQAANVKDIYDISGLTGKQKTWTQFLNVPTVQAFLGIPDTRFASAFDTIKVLFNLPLNLSTVTPSRFIVTKNGIVQGGSVVIDSIRADKKMVYLSGLGSILTQSGEYEFTVDLPNIQSDASIAGMQQQSIKLTVDNVGPQLVNSITFDSTGLDPQHIPYVKLDFDEDVYGFNTASLQLTRNGSVINLNIAQLSNSGLRNWIVGNLGMATYGDGDYTLTINLNGIRDAAGNFGNGTQQVSWTVNRSILLLVSNLSITPDLGFSAIDGVSSEQSVRVAFTLGSNASKVTLAQVDLSGERVLGSFNNILAGDTSFAVNLAGGGNSRIKVTAIGTVSGVGVAEKALFIDQTPLTGTWLFAPNQNLPAQTDTISILLSSRLLNDTVSFKNALHLQHNGQSLATTNLHIQKANDTLYNVYNLRQAAAQQGSYTLSLHLDSLQKSSSGKKGNSAVSVSWMFTPVNRAPVAKAGKDTTIVSPGYIVLNATGSSDADGDTLTYRWIAPNGIALNDSSSATPGFSITNANLNGTYAFLLIVSDGKTFSSSVVKVNVNLTVCPGSNTYYVMPRFGFGGAYQWQIDSTGTGFVNLTGNDAQHIGVTSDTLRLVGLPTTFRGYKYRCVNDDGISVKYSTVYVVAFQSIWLGTANNAWENGANWSCASVPDEFTEVTVAGGRPNQPVVSQSTVVYGLKGQEGATVTIKPGVNLEVKGK